MTLDPQVATILDFMAAQPGAPLGERPIAETRAMSAAATVRSAEPVHHVEDIVAPTPVGDIRLRAYRPSADDHLGVVVFFHGGGFVLGDIETHDDLCRVLANRSGCVVVAVEYRLAPEHPFPAAADDAYAATAWVAEHAEELGGDPARLAVAGDSAGGNLAAVVPLMARDRGGPDIRFQLLVYPMIEAEFDGPSRRDLAEGYLLAEKDLQFFWRQYVPDAADRDNPYASPLRAAELAGLPAAMVVTTEFDPLRDEGEAYASRLEEAGVPVTVRRHAGVIHGFWSMRSAIAAADPAIDEAAGALRDALAATHTA